MARDRNKPIKSWIERAKIETEELTIERAYELGKIRGKKDTIDKACRWLMARNVLTDASIEGFRKAMLMEG